MAKKYHINGDGIVGVCNAVKRPCRFGAADHFPSRETANDVASDRLQEKYKIMRAGIQKEIPSITHTLEDWDNLNSSEKANLAVFEGLKNVDLLQIGVHNDTYYGHSIEIKPELLEKLRSAGIDPKNVDEYASQSNRNLIQINNEILKKNGWTLDFVPGTLKQDNLEEFSDSYSDPDQVTFISAEAVLTIKNGTKIKIPIEAKTTFAEVMGKILDNPPGPIDWVTGRKIEALEEEMAKKEWQK